MERLPSSPRRSVWQRNVRVEGGFSLDGTDHAQQQLSFSAPIGAPAGFYQPTISVVINGFTMVIVFPVQVN